MNRFKSNKTEKEITENDVPAQEPTREPVEDSVQDSTNEKKEEDNVESTQEDSAAPNPQEELKKELEEQKDKYLRLQAEFDNFRRRTLREKMELIESGGKDVILKILPVLDDMYRATEASKQSVDIEAIRKGEMLILQKFIGILEGIGVKEIQTKGEPFNEELEEAVTRLKAGEELSGKVIDVLERGYTLKEKVIRYAKVVVGE